MPRPLSGLFVTAVLATFAAQAAEPVARAERPFEVARIPTWVQPVPLEPSTESPDGTSDASVRYRLHSQQIRITAAGVERFSRAVRQFKHPAGLEQDAEIEIHFAPSFERLIFHGVWLERDGKRTYVFDPSQVKVIQQERALEERLYEGTLSAILFVPDVRVGDSIEYAYTVQGQNPVFAGRFFDAVDASFSVPVDLWRLRLLVPSERTLTVRSHGVELEPTITEAAGVREYVWERRSLAPVHLDDQLPGWFDPFAWISFSEFASWAEVAQWAAPLYVPSENLDGAIASKVAELKKRSTPEERLIAALRFVQDEIRYLGIELGPHSHQPHAPAETLGRRFGDCKDKSLLLVTLLRAMEIEANVALVNTRSGKQLEERLPSPGAFDHVIVRAKLGTREFWVDPTASLERGSIEHLIPPPFQKALVVDSATTALTDLPFPEATEPEMEIEESYTATDRAAPVKLTVTMRHRGSSANRMRRHIAATPIAELSREYLNYYARSDPKIRVTTPLKIQDSAATNEISLTEEYAIEDFWKDGRRDLYGSEVARFLQKPRITQRTMPLEVPHPVHVRQIIRLDPPEALKVEADSGELEGRAAKFEYNFRGAGRTVLLDFRYRSLADAVMPKELPAHLQMLEKMQDQLGYWVRIDSGVASAAAPSKDRGRPAFFLPVFLFVLLVLFTVSSGAFRTRQKPATEPVAERRTPLSRIEVAPGESAATAIVVTGLAEQQMHLQQMRCTCGVRGVGRDTSTMEIPLVLAGREIVAVKWKCPSCSTDRAAYFTSDEGQKAAS